MQKIRLTQSKTLLNNKIDEIVGFLQSNPATIYSIGKRTELINLITQEFSNLTELQIKEISTHLTKIYNDSRVVVSSELGLPFSVTSDFQAQELLNRIDNGMNLSQRLHYNNSTIAERVNNDINRLLYQKASPEDIKRAISADYNISYNASDRLIRTETSKFYNTAAVDSYKAAGITEVEWFAADDERTCDECGPLHGEIYNINTPPSIPAHPNCRCTLLPVIKD